MKKILTFLATLALTFSLTAFEGNLLKVDELANSSLGECYLSGDNWYVDYSGAANTIKAKNNTEIKVKDGFMYVKFFTNYLDKVSIKLVPSFNTKFAEADLSYGKISNVGEIKSITLKCYNFGYDNTVYLNLKRSNGEILKYKMNGDLRSGITELKFENGNYISDPRFKEFKSKPIYPNSANDLYLESIEIHSNSKSPCDGYNFIGIGDINIVYDKATLEQENTINFDELFEMDNTKLNSEKEKELKKVEERKRQELHNQYIMEEEKSEVSEK